MFNEPGGISVARNKLYIADTNNHRIRVADLEVVSASGADTILGAGGAEESTPKLVTCGLPVLPATSVARTWTV